MLKQNEINQEFGDLILKKDTFSIEIPNTMFTLTFMNRGIEIALSNSEMIRILECRCSGMPTEVSKNFWDI